MAGGPLLPTAASPPGPPGRGARRPGSQHSSPAKEIITAVEHGDAGGALRAAGGACLRYPLLLLAAALLLMGGAGFVAWRLGGLEGQQPAMLVHVTKRQNSPRQRAFFEALTEQHRHIIGSRTGPPPPRLQQQQYHAGGAASLDSLALPRPTSLQGQQQQQQPGGQDGQGQQQQQQQLDQVQQQARAPGAAAADDNEPMFDIHKLAGVPQLFGAAKAAAAAAAAETADERQQ